MSGVFGNLGKKITTTLDSAQKDLRQSFAKSLSVAANTLAVTHDSNNDHGNSASSKTRLFSTILERSIYIRNAMTNEKCNQSNSTTTVTGTIAESSTIMTDGGNENRMSSNVHTRLEKEFCDLIEAYELLLAERIHLEEILTGGIGQLESLDDLESVSQYYRALQDTLNVAKREVARLTEQVEALEAARRNDLKRISIHENRALTSSDRIYNQTKVESSITNTGMIEFAPNAELKNDNFGEAEKDPSLLSVKNDDNTDITSDNCLTELKEKETTKTITTIPEASMENLEISEQVAALTLNTSTEELEAAKQKIIVLEKSMERLRIAEQKLAAFEMAREELKLATQKVVVLETSVEELKKQKSTLLTELNEQRAYASSLETQKMALETKVGYLQKQLQDYETLRLKLKEVSHSGQAELESAQKELCELKRRYDLSESNLISSRKQLDAVTLEMEVLREELERENQTKTLETNRLDNLVTVAKDLLTEERKRADTLSTNLKNTLSRVQQLEISLSDKETLLLKQNRAISIESIRQTPSIKSVTTLELPEADKHGHQSIKALKQEYEKLALENSRLKSTTQAEHLRNIILRYLQLPDQRQTLLPILSTLLHLNKDELASIKK